MKRPLVEAAVNNNHIQNGTRAAFKSVGDQQGARRLTCGNFPLSVCDDCCVPRTRRGGTVSSLTVSGSFFLSLPPPPLVFFVIKSGHYS